MKRRTRNVCGAAALALTISLTACGTGGARRDNGGGYSDYNSDNNNGGYGDYNGDYNNGNNDSMTDSAGDRIRNGLDDAGDRIRDGIDDAGDRIRDGIDSAGDKIRDAARNGAYISATPTAADEITRRAHEALTGTGQNSGQND